LIYRGYGLAGRIEEVYKKKKARLPVQGRKKVIVLSGRTMHCSLLL
jgi:hypothetical protein